MSKLRKLTNNILSPDAWRVLGNTRYLQLLAIFLRKLPSIMRTGDLRPLDQAMANRGNTFRFRSKTLHFDCIYCDAIIQDGSYAFGIVREILIRDCYLRYLPSDTLNDLVTVVDLGANRGMFSILAAAFAQRVLSIEADPAFRPVIEHNARINGFDHVAVETMFIGAGGALGDVVAHSHIDLNELLDHHGFNAIDLVKIDIEGSEFALFACPDWLPRVRRICMEVHRNYGDVQQIVKALEAQGFSIAYANSNLQRIGAASACEFLYAWR